MLSFSTSHVPRQPFVLISALATLDELAQVEEDAEDYDLEALELQTNARVIDDDDDDDTLAGGHRGGPASIAEVSVIFDIGDEDNHGSNE